MLQAIEQDRSPRVSGPDARRAIEIIRAIYLSAQRSQAITLPLTDSEA
jgi:hypothetical protein